MYNIIILAGVWCRVKCAVDQVSPSGWGTTSQFSEITGSTHVYIIIILAGGRCRVKCAVDQVSPSG